jgi:hypothetical protein
MFPNFLLNFVISVSLLWTQDIPHSSREIWLQNYFRSDHLLFPVSPVPFSLSRRFCFLSLSLEHPSFDVKLFPFLVISKRYIPLECLKWVIIRTVYIDLWKRERQRWQDLSEYNSQEWAYKMTLSIRIHDLLRLFSVPELLTVYRTCSLKTMNYEDDDCRINCSGNYGIQTKPTYPSRIKCNSNSAICEDIYPKLWNRKLHNFVR